MAIDRLTYTNALCVGDFVVNLQYKDWREYESISSNGKLVVVLAVASTQQQTVACRPPYRGLATTRGGRPRGIYQQRGNTRVEYISKEEILAGIAEGLRDVKAGRTRPAEELLNELRNGISD